MTGLIAGYMVAIAAILFAASTALTIIYNVNRLFDMTEEQPSFDERDRKVAA